MANQLGQNKRLSSRRRQRQRSDRRKRIAAPPALDATVVCTKRFRFQAQSAGLNFAVTAADICQFLSLVDTTTSAYALIDRFKIERVELYGPMPESLAPVTVSLEYAPSASGFASPTKKYSDTSMSASCAAYISEKPEPMSLASQWVNASVGNMFIVNCPVNTIMDIIITFCLNDGNASGSYVVSSTLVGYIGTPDLSTVFDPVGWRRIV